MSETSQTSTDVPVAGFGPNEWLVDEIYQKYLADPQSVDRAWWDFFADYQPVDTLATKPAPTADDAAAESAPELTPAAVAASSDLAPAPAPAPAPAAPSTPAAPAPARAPSTPAAPTAAAPAPSAPAEPSEPAGAGPEVTKLRGPAARVVTNMESSLEIPTATSVRAVPAKLLIDNRTIINNHLRRGRGGKVSFTHLIGYALVRAITGVPAMNAAYDQVDGKPAVLTPEHVGLGLAIDLAKPDGSRQLLVPSIKRAETLDFAAFWASYEDMVRRARNNKLTLDDFAGTTITLTNPGTIGTVHSVPRLMRGQGAIIGVGAMEYPAEWSGASAETLARHAISKILTLTSTYDHRIIQGAQSGEFLRRLHELLLGADGFYDEIFTALRIPYEPVRWVSDISASHEDDINKTARVQELIHAYRVRGHLMADTDPLEYEQRRHPDLDIVNHGLTLWDLDREFPTGGFGGTNMAPLREILGILRDSYVRTIGIEYMHIQDPVQRQWIQQRVETPLERPDRDQQLHILRRLNAAEAFETFLQTKYVGQKRFSLEGAESVIPLLDAVLSRAAERGLEEVAIGMPHRGRLNVLANIVGKSYGQIFREFEGGMDPGTAHGSGDVKYHLGAEGSFTTPEGWLIPVTLAANPSHLEAVDPVLEGMVRAKQDLLDQGDKFPVLPILLHGDAAFAGQGVVTETLHLSQLRGYRTGGTIHVIVNNQVGFTTSPTSSRSSVYASDAARMIQAPIFHVNGDDPEACARVARMAFEFRQAFKKDVVVDLVCYRRRGHNEADDPSLTQPLMYSIIDNKRSVRKLYTEQLVGRGDITLEEAEEALRDYQQQLERVFQETRSAAADPAAEEPAEVELTGEIALVPRDESHERPTAIAESTMKTIATGQVAVPDGFTVHSRLAPQLQRRVEMVEKDAIDWAMGETLALGSLLMEGVPVRLAGQDSRRGTFGQRHAVFVDRATGDEYAPLRNLTEDQAKFYAYDSLLSEYAAMGFEYGYSAARPDALVLWEAQFGDFANGAQIIIDQFIASSEQKWGTQAPLTLLLPHGYEGQGPEHSSARIERFLTLCAQDNMTVAYPSSPASYFHLLRRQGLSSVRRPLVVFTPKSMLRLKAAASAARDFTEGTFQPVISDSGVDAAGVRTVLLCSGKVYYDLVAARAEQGRTDVAIVRVERLYPLAEDDIAALASTFRSAQEFRWVQEEPANMGPWPFMGLHLPAILGRPLTPITRPASSSPAVGSHHRHEAEQAELVARALA